MSKSERDPLFFPPSKHPPGEDDEPEGYSAEVDTASQQKPLRLILILGVALGFLLWRGCG